MRKGIFPPLLSVSASCFFFDVDLAPGVWTRLRGVLNTAGGVRGDLKTRTDFVQKPGKGNFHTLQRKL